MFVDEVLVEIEVLVDILEDMLNLTQKNFMNNLGDEHRNTWYRKEVKGTRLMFDEEVGQRWSERRGGRGGKRSDQRQYTWNPGGSAQLVDEHINYNVKVTESVFC